MGQGWRLLVAEPGKDKARQSTAAHCPSYSVPFTSVRAEVPARDPGHAHTPSPQAHVHTANFSFPTPDLLLLLGSPAALQVVSLGRKGLSHPCLESLAWVREEGGHVSTGWPLCVPPCLPIHAGLVPAPTPSHIQLPGGWCVFPQGRARPDLCSRVCVHGIQGALGKRQSLHIMTKNVRISVKWSSLRDMLKVCMWQGAL